MVTPIVKAPEKGTRRFELFKELEDIRRDMDDVFESFGLRFPRLRSSERLVWRPRIDMFEKEDTLVIRADLPGMERNDIKLHIADDVLTLEGQRTFDEEVDEDDYFAREMFYGHFLRRIPLPMGVKTEDINAKFKNGLLKIVVPKVAAMTPREIPVEIA